MPRAILAEAAVHPAIRDTIADHHRDIIDEVIAAIAVHDVVVVGMKQNPFPKRARKLLTEQRIAFHYLEYGSYLNTWRRRNALKMWTGWPTFPMIFIKGTLIGGAANLEKLVASGELTTLLAAERRAGEAK
ncbi:MAG: glutaredoxin [Kofleriaceae bacterium]